MRDELSITQHAVRRRGCRGAQVDTVSFQAPEFYQRLGFEVVGSAPDFPPGHARCFLFKLYD